MSHSGSNAPRHFDIERSLERLAGDRQTLIELAEIFLQSLPRTVDRLKQAVAARDGEGIRFAAHRIKGGASNFFADDTFEAARYLEQLGKDRSFDDADQALRDLLLQLDALVAELRDLPRP